MDDSRHAPQPTDGDQAPLIGDGTVSSESDSALSASSDAVSTSDYGRSRDSATALSIHDSKPESLNVELAEDSEAWNAEWKKLTAEPPMWRRIATGVAVILCLGGFFWGFGSEKNQEPAPLPNGIEAVLPLPGAVAVPGQSTISADMKFGYEGALVLDGVEIPKDQAIYVLPTALLTFTPGPGKDYRILQGGLRHVTLLYWPTGADRNTAAKTFSWSFNVN